MKVKIRHIDDGNAIDFTECRYDELDGVIDFIKKSGGVYCKGNTEPFYSYQLCLDDNEAYAEIIIGNEE